MSQPGLSSLRFLASSNWSPGLAAELFHSCFSLLWSCEAAAPVAQPVRRGSGGSRAALPAQGRLRSWGRGAGDTLRQFVSV